MKKTKDAMRVLKRLTVLVVNEDGVEDRVPQTIYIDPRGDASFVMKLPSYISENLGCPAEVRSPLAEKIVGLFEAKMREYLSWYRTKKAEPVIILMVNYASAEHGSDRNDKYITFDEGHMHFFGGDHVRDAVLAVAVSVSYKLAFRINGEIHHRKEDRSTEKRGNYLPGFRMAYVDGIVLDYTPELHAKIDRICDAIYAATVTMREIVSAKDVGRALLEHKAFRLTGPKT